ncbi:carbamate kinase [bacterium]|nr:MAG: carbamate kinase [bacterium]
MDNTPIAVVALGGNAISSPSEPDTIPNQFRHTRTALQGVSELIRRGYRLAVTHGNGPQVGNALLRVELATDQAPNLPLGIIVADTEGGMGYMIEQCLQNVCTQKGVDVGVITVVTQVRVDPEDPALLNPTKFIGKYYSRAEARRKAETQGWQVRENGKHGWRRVVGSPQPLEIINAQAIKQLIESGMVVIAAGGGGIPVYRRDDGWYEGIDAVIDKDRASAVLGNSIGASELFILTDTEHVSLNWGKPNQQDLKRITVSETKRYYAEGHFPPGSMGPKIEAAISFIEGGGKRVIICSLDRFIESLEGNSGTEIIPDGSGI